MKAEAFECDSCGELQCPRVPHPKWSHQFIGHCGRCCSHSDELYVNEGWSGPDEYVCSGCNEKACESSLRDYYGGSGPMTVNEQCAAAYAQKKAAKR